eukprot:scaffold16873_cov58-Phaeocystis_antarctica.AAC.4
MLALLISVWPLLLAGLVLRWWTLTPSTARASFSQEGPGLSSRPESPLVRRRRPPPTAAPPPARPPVGRPVHA